MDSHPLENLAGTAGILRTVIGNADIERFPLAYRAGQRLHGFLQRRIRIGAVMIENIHVIQPKPLQALIQRGKQVLFGAPLPIRTGPHVISGFCGDYELIAIRREILFENPSEGNLGASRPWAIVVCNIKMGNAFVKRKKRKLPCPLIRYIFTEIVPQPQRKEGQPNPAFSTPVVKHMVISARVCTIQENSSFVLQFLEIYFLFFGYFFG